MAEGIIQVSRLATIGAGPTGARNILILFILVIIGLILAVAIMAVWGALLLIGMLLIVISGLVILLNRGQSPDRLFLFAMVAGVIFIILSVLGIDVGNVDLRVIPGFESIHDFFHP